MFASELGVVGLIHQVVKSYDRLDDSDICDQNTAYRISQEFPTVSSDITYTVLITFV